MCGLPPISARNSASQPCDRSVSHEENCVNFFTGMKQTDFRFFRPFSFHSSFPSEGAEGPNHNKRYYSISSGHWLARLTATPAMIPRPPLRSTPRHATPRHPAVRHQFARQTDPEIAPCRHAPHRHFSRATSTRTASRNGERARGGQRRVLMHTRGNTSQFQFREILKVPAEGGGGGGPVLPTHRHTTAPSVHTRLYQGRQRNDNKAETWWTGL